MIAPKLLKVLLTLAMAVCLFTAMAIPAFATPAFSDYPTPTPSPDPYNPTVRPATPTPVINSTSVTAIHVNASLAVYFMNYVQQVSWSNGNIQSDGTLAAGGNYRTTPQLSVNGIKLIACRNYSNDAWMPFYSVLFYDSDGNPISGGYYTGTFYNFTNIPDNAYFVRFSISAAYSGSQAKERYRPALSPSLVDIYDDTFWFTQVSPISYLVNDDGLLTFSVQNNNFPVDDLMVYIDYSDSYISGNIVSTSIFTQVRDGRYNNSLYPLEYNDSNDREADSSLTFVPYYYDDIGDRIYSAFFDSTQSANPFNCSAELSSKKFSGFRAIIPLFKTSGLQTGTEVTCAIDPVQIDSITVIADSIVSNVIDDLNSVGDSLVLPTPNVEVIYNQFNNVVGNLNNQDFRSVQWFGNSDGILVTMMVIVFVFGFLGYLFYGKMV